MKPRVLLTARSFRLVQQGDYAFTLEKIDGYDAMKKMRWIRVEGPYAATNGCAILREIGEALNRRRKRRQKR